MVDETLQPFVPGKWWNRLLIAYLMLPFVWRLSPWAWLDMLARTGYWVIPFAGLSVLATHGVRLRRGTWTGQSWTWFFVSVVTSLAAVGQLLATALNADSDGSWFGERGSYSSSAFGVSSLVIGFIGVGMFAGAVFRFARDPVGSQYTSRLQKIFF